MTDSKEWCDGDWRCRSSSKPFAGAESGSPGRALEAGKRGSPGRAVQAGIRGKRLNKLKHFLPAYFMKTLYSTLIESHLQYCTLLWANSHVTNI